MGEIKGITDRLNELEEKINGLNLKLRVVDDMIDKAVSRKYRKNAYQLLGKIYGIVLGNTIAGYFEILDEQKEKSGKSVGFSA